MSSAAYRTLTADCASGVAMIDLDVNNVRARLLTGGDWWWDVNRARYVVPKVDPAQGEVEVSSLFSGALWAGGIDADGNVRVAAPRYRQGVRSDFWPGPLDHDGSTRADRCAAHDRFWSVRREDIDAVAGAWAAGRPLSLAELPEGVRTWPARGNPHAEGRAGQPLVVDGNLAPFVDVDGNGLYDPTTGDHPDVPGDQAIFWSFNDAGNAHGETGGPSIGLEVRALAYAFATGDALNDQTFYRLELLHYGTAGLEDMYLGLFTDVDLGWYLNDFVGCDTSLDLAYAYNGTAVDGGGMPNYGDRPPLVGVQLLQTPWRRLADGDSVRPGMTTFSFLYTAFDAVGWPVTDRDHWYRMQGRWLDGTPFTFGGNGYGGTTPFPFQYPDDPSLPLPAWSECAQGNPPADRQFLQATGGFAFPPGRKVPLEWAVLWVRPEGPQDGCRADVDALRRVAGQVRDSHALAFADVLDGPDAPDLTIEEGDGRVRLRLSNGPGSNNAGEAYRETDPVLRNLADLDPTDSLEDPDYRFQGYLIYQLRDATVSVAEVDNPSRARLVAQVDLADGVGRLVNRVYDPVLQAQVPVLMVDGRDEGIEREFLLERDAFADPPGILVNHRTYRYTAVAYAYNGMAPWNPDFPEPGRRPFLAGRRNRKVYTAIPHRPLTGTELASTDSACRRAAVVPNPYYAHSGYETGTNDRVIRFTNLPGRCTVTVYTLDGQRVRRLERDVPEDQTAGAVQGDGSPNRDNSLAWDLTNEAGLPVGSGCYLAHVRTPSGCERVLKACVVQRPVDLDGLELAR
jgi:hypothetical protein